MYKVEGTPFRETFSRAFRKIKNKEVQLQNVQQIFYLEFKRRIIQQEAVILAN
jgi:hypothetical protein